MAEGQKTFFSHPTLSKAARPPKPIPFRVRGRGAEGQGGARGREARQDQKLRGPPPCCGTVRWGRWGRAGWVPERASWGLPRAVGRTQFKSGVGPGTGLLGASQGRRADPVQEKWGGSGNVPERASWPRAGAVSPGGIRRGG